MAKKHKTVFAQSEDGRLYVKLAAVMSPMIALIDALPLTFFGKGKTPYLAIDDAIEWCRKEAVYHSPDKYKLMIDVMKKAKAQNPAPEAP
jgi:hypothetical protein